MRPVFSKSVAVPWDILAVKRATLSEKLLLAILAGDPHAKHLTRALGIGSAGLRKLKQRLIDRQFLIPNGARSINHLHGLTSVLDAGRGYNVSGIPVAKTVETVTRPLSKVTALDTQPLVVPAELLDFPHLSASEKLLLAFYAAKPAAPNNQVLEALGVSRAGLKKLKRRLVAKHVLVPTEKGYSIRLPGLVFTRDADGGHFLSESDAVQNENKIALPAPRLTPAKDIAVVWERHLKHLFVSARTRPRDIQKYTAQMIRRVQAESPDGSNRDAVLAKMQIMEDKHFALQLVADNIPSKHFPKYYNLMTDATPAQLATFRKHAEAMWLDGLSEPRQLEMVLQAIAQMM